MSGSCVWYSAISAGESERLRAYSTTSLSLPAPAEVFGLEAANLQLDRTEAVQAAMEEQEVEDEVTIPDLHRILGAHEAEVAAELDQEVLQFVNELAMQIPE